MNTRGNNPLWQTLEERKMMSLTPGIEYTAAIAPPPPPVAVQVNQPFELQGPPPAMGFAAFRPMEQPEVLGPAIDRSPATSNETETVVSPMNAISVSSGSVPTGTITLSSLYASLGVSTVTQIDSAEAGSFEYFRDPASSTANESAFSAMPLAVGQFDETAIRQAGDSGFSVTSDKALARALSVVTAPFSSTSIERSAAPGWASLRSLEDRLNEVKSIANQAVMELGRDSAIVLSHLESEMDAGLNIVESAMPRSALGSAALTSAVIAAIALAREERNRDQHKTSPIFSSRLIEATGV